MLESQEVILSARKRHNAITWPEKFIQSEVLDQKPLIYGASKITQNFAQGYKMAERTVGSICVSLAFTPFT